MKLIYNDDPLSTKIILDDAEKKYFRKCIQYEELMDASYGAYFHLRDCNQWFSVKQAQSSLSDIEDIINDTGRIQELYDYYIADLENGIHCGDCTAFPASCVKCYAEGLLDIDTMKLPIHSSNKSIGHRLYGMYKDNITIDEAIHAIETQILTSDDLPRLQWTLDYLKEYKELLDTGVYKRE